MKTKRRDCSETEVHDLALQSNLRYYEEHATDFTGRTQALALDEVYAHFLELIPPGGAILDAGCGSGRDSLAFLNKGYKVKAIDVSPSMVRETRKLGVNADVVNFQDLTFNNQFDGIWACASLLHIPKSEIPEVLSRFVRALKRNGILFVSLKEGEGQRVAEDGRFFSYFRLGEFSAHLEAAGFVMIDGARSVADDGREWLNFLARKA